MRTWGLFRKSGLNLSVGVNLGCAYATQFLTEQTPTQPIHVTHNLDLSLSLARKLKLVRFPLSNYEKPGPFQWRYLSLMIKIIHSKPIWKLQVCNPHGSHRRGKINSPSWIRPWGSQIIYCKFCNLYKKIQLIWRY